MECYFALCGLNYKPDDRITMCPRGTDSLADISESIDPNDIINNENFTNIRKMLHQGKWPEHCKSCRDQESRNQTSYRMKANKLLKPIHFKNSLDDFKIKNTNLEYIELRFSNACNLSCRHCAPDYSSKWNSIQKTIQPIEDDYKHNIKNITQKWPNQSWNKQQVEDLVNSLINNFPNLNRLDIAGGEPLYQKQFWQFLDRIQHHPNISNMYINITSNFNTPVNYEKLSVYMNKFGKSQIKISVDAGRNLYDYFRNGKYENIIKNLKEFQSHNKKTILEATNTITPYQVLDIDNIIKDMLDLPVDKIHHSFVQYPTYLGMDVLHNQRYQIIKKVKRIHKKLKEDKNASRENRNKLTGAIKMTSMIMQAMNNTKESKKDVEAFIYYTKRIDNIKDQNFSKVFTESVDKLIW